MYSLSHFDRELCWTRFLRSQPSISIVLAPLETKDNDFTQALVCLSFMLLRILSPPSAGTENL